jgi:hypothetical protein
MAACGKNSNNWITHRDVLIGSPARPIALPIALTGA